MVVVSDSVLALGVMAAATLVYMARSSTQYNGSTPVQVHT